MGCFNALGALAGGGGTVGRTVVVIGGGEVGLETALFLAHQGRKVVVLEMLGSVGGDVNSQYGGYLIQLLAEHGVEVRTDHEVEKVTAEGVIVVDKRAGGAVILVEAESGVTATGFRPNTQVYKELQQSAAEVYNIGSSVKIGRILEAVSDAQFVAQRL